jgi:hypothetical protein
VRAQRDRSRVHEARVAGLAISLSVIALALVVFYVLAGFTNRVVIQIVTVGAAAGSTTEPR